jgi:ABC-type antimicrobial peptide transport system permease subunit
VELSPQDSPAAFDKLLTGFSKRHLPAQGVAGYDMLLQPLREVHYDERLGNFRGRTFSRSLITTLNLIGIFLLVIACINFINLSTAQAINRAREVGVRKVLGGNRRQLLLQFLGETGLTCLAALVAAMVLALALVPALNQLLESHLSTALFREPSMLLLLAGVFVITTLCAGLYPALVLSGFNPVRALKSRIAAETGRGVSLRRGLVILQFTIAQGLIIATLVVLAQMNYFKNADLGFSKDFVVTAGFPDDSLSRTRVNLLHDQLLRDPGVQAVSFSMVPPVSGGGWYTDLRFSTNHTDKPDLIVGMMPADTAYFSLYHLQLAAGRVYFPSDTLREFMVNETLLKKLNLGSPQEVIGKTINVMGKTLPIVGVVRDFHHNSLRDPISALVFIPRKRTYGTANVRVAPGKASAVLADMAKIWNKDFPDNVFEYHFVDQAVANLYKQENQLSALYRIFAGVAILISCLGLYGLISFMAVRRKKEIGVRKVLGAQVSGIVYLLSREFTLLVFLAFLIAAPLAWYFMHQWLQQYTYRIEIGAGIFAVTILSSLAIAWISVGYTAVRAARANPVDSLRTE